MFVLLYSAYKLSRPINFIISFLSILVAGIICKSLLFNWVDVLLAAFAGAFTGAAGNIINDYFDCEIDKINRPQRILPLGIITKKQALQIYFSFLIIVLAFTIGLNVLAVTIVIFTNVIIFLYSYKLKKIPLVGNFIVSFFTGLAFIYGGAAVYNYKGALIPALFAFLINFIREIVKDIEDIKGDSMQNVYTFPGVYGYKKSYYLIFMLTVVLILLTFIPFIFEVYKIEYFLIINVIINPILIYILKNMWKDNSKKNISTISALLKVNMIFGLIAIYMGV
ncbi:MAG: geranylgeranylglycerol-phosphate geranylgeranyltransferase [bacterium]